MKIALEFPPHNDCVAIHLAVLRGNTVFMAETAEPIFVQVGDRGSAIFRKDPWITMQPMEILELHESLTSELQRLGLIRPTPSQKEVQALESNLSDARKSRDNAFKILENMSLGLMRENEKS